jgi:phage tail sheath protein FI
VDDAQLAGGGSSPAHVCPANRLDHQMLTGQPPIAGVDTGIAGFAGATAGPDPPVLVTSIAELEGLAGAVPPLVGRMVRGFFANGGTRAYVAGRLAALEAIDEIALLCPLPEASGEAIAQCERRRDRVAILSLPAGVGSVKAALAARPTETSAFAGVHYPWVRAGGELTPPGGHVAGVYASTGIGGTPGGSEIDGLDDPPLELSLPASEIPALVAGGINSLRDLRAVGRGVRLWSTRTLDPDPERRFLPVQRLLIFLQTSIARGLLWAAVECNEEALWARVREAVDMFLMEQWSVGRLPGSRPNEAFFVRCDRTTMSQQYLDAGRLVCLIGVATVRPAEFVIFRIGQFTKGRCP